MLVRGTDGFKNHFLIQLPGKYDPDNVRMVLHDFFQQLYAAHARHLHVGYDRIKRLLIDKIEGCPAVCGKAHFPLVAHAAQHSLQAFEQQFFIIDKKNSSFAIGSHISLTDPQGVDRW